jgi:D-serine deaminase-like pyridoxal phosphate-dependent protein
MIWGMEDIRVQIEAVIRLAESTSARPTPKNARAVAELATTVATAQEALAVVIAQVRDLIVHQPPASEREARALYIIAHRLSALGDNLRATSARVHAAITRQSGRN